jgi:uncharacterized protein YukE
MKFKYTTKFNNPITSSERQIQNFNESSKASLDNLKSLIPEDIDFKKNIDLLGVAFNGALINTFNRNGDGIDTSTAMAIKDYFIHKPTNIEHDKKKVVGHIVSTGFSSIEDSSIIKDLDSGNLNPFNLSMGAVVYASANKEFAKLVEDSVNPEGDKYMKISASWELGFNDYLIAAGSENLNEAEIISEEKHIKELSQYLKAFDGDGKLKDGTPIYRLVVGEVYPLGIGFTANPAAKVKGLYMHGQKKKDSENSTETYSTLKKITVDNKDYFIKNKKNISQKGELHVIESINKISTMDKQDLLEDFKTILDEKIPNHGFNQEVVANVGRVIGDAIKSKSEQYEQELLAIEEERVKLAETEKKMQEDVEELKSQLESSQSELGDLKQEIEARKSEEAFDARMEQIDSEYELSKEDRVLLASEVKSISLEDSDFEEYKSKVSVMWAHKNKTYIEEQEKVFTDRLEAEIQKRELSEISEASDETEEAEEKSIEEVLENVEPEKETVANNNSDIATEEPSLREKFAKVFDKENLTIKL